MYGSVGKGNGSGNGNVTWSTYVGAASTQGQGKLGLIETKMNILRSGCGHGTKDGIIERI